MTKYLNAPKTADASETRQAEAPETKSSKVRYTVWSSEDGVDDTFEVYSQVDSRRIAWTSYWKYDMPPEAERRAGRNAELIARFLELIANNYISLELRELIREVLHWRIIHGISHMQRNYPDLTEAEIRTFFQRVGYDQVDCELDDVSLLWRYDELRKEPE